VENQFLHEIAIGNMGYTTYRGRRIKKVKRGFKFDDKVRGHSVIHEKLEDCAAVWDKMCPPIQWVVVPKEKGV
jgi:hypothetical protein